MIKLYKSFISAIQFCTSIPIPVKTDQDDLKNGISFFPISGILIGLICGLTYNFSSMIWNQNVSSVLTLCIYLIITRALHMDGFMDTIDGFFSGKSAEKILSIMKDSKVGSFAVCGAICWFGWQIEFLPLIKWQQMILIHCLSRWGIIYLALISDYPRESGTGKFFIENVKTRQLILGFFMNLGIIYWLGTYNLILFVFIFIYGWIVSAWSKNKIGGITGDVLGFFIESSTLLSLLILSLLNKFSSTLNII